MGPRAVLDAVVKRKIPSRCRDSKTSDHKPVAQRCTIECSVHSSKYVSYYFAYFIGLNDTCSVFIKLTRGMATCFSL
jgi:hypothetical protein